MNITSPAEQLLYATVRIETEADGQRGAGTGFFFAYSEGQLRHLFIVTNKHVVRGAQTGRLLFTRSDGEQPKIGERVTLTLTDFETRWYGHPDDDVDVAVTPLDWMLMELKIREGKDVFIRAVSDNLIPNPQAVAELDALERIVFVGYPSALYDQVNLTPILRVGVTATPVALDYGGRRVFLIDASVFPGSSGSPVFILDTAGYFAKDGSLTIGSRVYFLGLISDVFFRTESGQIRVEDAPTLASRTASVRQMIDLGIVQKAVTVVEAVQEALVKGRAARA